MSQMKHPVPNSDHDKSLRELKHELAEARKKIRCLQSEKKQLEDQLSHDNYFWTSMIGQLLLTDATLYSSLKDHDSERIYLNGSNYYYSLADQYKDHMRHSRHH
ncbi:MAG: hypothetical protein KGQ58_03720 [Proteobacteria bacterium]|nr:hypothetical protein [Pseudomonadota bacterium]MDE3208934.1 hypothetical protein [Pseudomonadota bacterium]